MGAETRRDIGEPSGKRNRDSAACEMMHGCTAAAFQINAQIAVPPPSARIAALQDVEGKPVGVVQNLVDLVFGLSSPAGRAAGFQRPDAAGPGLAIGEMAGFPGLRGVAVSVLRNGVAISVLRNDRVAGSPPAGKTPGLRRQVVECCGKCGEPAAKARRVDRVVWRRRRREGKPLGDAGHRDARHAFCCTTWTALPTRKPVEKRQRERAYGCGLTPTPNPSPQGGGRFCGVCAWRNRCRTVCRADASLPLVGRGKGWG